MAAYLIYCPNEITNPGALEEYRLKIPATLEKHGGRHLAADSDFDVMEGDWTSKRVILIEFPDMDALKGWYNSDDYKPLREIRWGASSGDMIFVNGH